MCLFGIMHCVDGAVPACDQTLCVRELSCLFFTVHYATMYVCFGMIVISMFGGGGGGSKCVCVGG